MKISILLLSTFIVFVSAQGSDSHSDSNHSEEDETRRVGFYATAFTPYYSQLPGLSSWLSSYSSLIGQNPINNQQVNSLYQDAIYTSWKAEWDSLLTADSSAGGVTSAVIGGASADSIAPQTTTSDTQGGSSTETGTTTPTSTVSTDASSSGSANSNVASSSVGLTLSSTSSGSGTAKFAPIGLVLGTLLLTLFN